MKPSRVLLVPLALATLMLVSPGCKEAGPSGGSSDPAAAQDKAAQGNTILVQKIVLIANSGSTDPSLFDFSTAASLYNEALSLDPENRDAHFGLALTDVLSIFSDPQVTGLLSKGSALALSPEILGSFVDLSSSPAEVLATYGNRLSTRFADMFEQRMAPMLGKGSVTLVDQPPSFYQNLVEAAILPKLISAIGHLNTVLADPTYAFLITPTMTGGNTTETYRIDATEIYLIRALLQFIVADASALVAYNVDYDPTDSAAVHQAWQSGSAFLAFRTNGAQRMADAHANFLGAATSVQGALNYLMNEAPNPQTDLINYNPDDGPAFLETIAGMDSIKMILSGPYPIPDGPTVNLSAFFNNAIPNYKLKVPSYTVTVMPGISPGTYDAVLTWTAATFDAWVFPDPTMNGLFPGMTDADLKVLMDVTADSWEPTVTIPGS